MARKFHSPPFSDSIAEFALGVRGFPGWVNGDQPDIIRFNIPSGITATSNGGTLVVTDQGSNRVRVLQKLCTPFYVGGLIKEICMRTRVHVRLRVPCVHVHVHACGHKGLKNAYACPRLPL